MSSLKVGRLEQKDEIVVGNVQEHCGQTVLCVMLGYIDLFCFLFTWQSYKYLLYTLIVFTELYLAATQGNFYHLLTDKQEHFFFLTMQRNFELSFMNFFPGRTLLIIQPLYARSGTHGESPSLLTCRNLYIFQTLILVGSQWALN